MSARESQLHNSQEATDVQPVILIAVSNAIKQEDCSERNQIGLAKKNSKYTKNKNKDTIQEIKKSVCFFISWLECKLIKLKLLIYK